MTKVTKKTAKHRKSVAGNWVFPATRADALRKIKIALEDLEQKTNKIREQQLRKTG